MFEVKIENKIKEILRLTNNESDYQVLSIEGLNPPPAQINTTTIAGLDGAKFNSSKLNSRNVVIQLKLNGDVEANRIMLYKYFSTKDWCKFYYKNDHRNVYIECYVETVEVTPFSQNEIMQISLLCPDPYFKDMQEIIDDISKVIALFTFPFSIDLEYNSSDLVMSDELKEQMLAQTSYLETSTEYPNNFGVTAGNFDGAGISWGAIQYNFGQVEANNTLSPIWQDLINNYPTVCQSCFTGATGTTDYNTWSNLILSGTYAELKTFSTNITDPNNAHQVIEPWNTYFSTLGMTDEAITRQITGASWYYEQALNWFPEFELWSKRGLSLCFDIAVQSGSISQSVKDLILSDFENITAVTMDDIETAKLIIIANRRADAVASEFRESYRQRKLAIANGAGYVYGNTLYLDTTVYGMTLDTAFENVYEGVGIPFSELDSSRTTNVYNNSESETGLIIEIDILNSCEKILIQNTGTGESITINNTDGFLENDHITVNTNKGSKSISLIRNAVTSNLFSKLQSGSTFFQLNIGDNLFSYEVDNGDNDEAVNVVFKHYTIYRGV